MKNQDRAKIIESLPFESRLAFAAFCVERCLKEAKRHPTAKKQLEKMPLLTKGLEMLWVRVERGVEPDPKGVQAILAQPKKSQKIGSDFTTIHYAHDFMLVVAARVLARGLRLLQKPQTRPLDVAYTVGDYIAGVDTVYEDREGARKSEAAVADSALLNLEKWGQKPIKRSVFNGIPEWNRGALSKDYAEHRVMGSVEDTCS